MRHDVAERNLELWMLAVSPATWALHFMGCYLTAAIWCAKAGRTASAQPTLVSAIAVYTAVALLAIAIVGARGWRRHRLGGEPPPHDDDTPEDRHRFLGWASFLLSALSAIAVCYSALVAVFLRSCT
jgi:hypothetical protein